MCADCTSTIIWKAREYREVAHQDSDLVAPALVDRRLAAPQHGGVHHIIVQQGRGMDEFDDGGQLDVIPFGIGEAVGAEQHQGRPQPFAAAVDDVVAQLVDERDAGAQFFVD